MMPEVTVGSCDFNVGHLAIATLTLALPNDVHFLMLVAGLMLILKQHLCQPSCPV